MSLKLSLMDLFSLVFLCKFLFRTLGDFASAFLSASALGQLRSVQRSPPGKQRALWGWCVPTAGSPAPSALAPATQSRLTQEVALTTGSPDTFADRSGPFFLGGGNPVIGEINLHLVLLPIARAVGRGEIRKREEK